MGVQPHLIRRSTDTVLAPVSPDGRTLEGIIHLGALLTSTLGLDEAAQQIVEYACILTGLPTFMLFVRRDDEPVFELRAIEGSVPELTDVRLRPIDVATLDLDRRGACAVSPAELRPPAFGRLLQAHGFPVVWAAPIVVEGVRLKGLLMGLDRRHERPDEGGLRVLRLLGMQAASALWNAERHEAELAVRAELDIELSRSQALQEVAVAGTSSAKLNDVADDLLLTMRRQLGAIAGHVRLREEEAGVMELLSAFGYPGDVLSRLRTMRRPVEGPRDEDMGDMSLAVVPIEARGEVMGELCLALGSGRILQDEEHALLETAARVAGQALENLRVFRAEHRIAETLQQTLLFLPPAIAGVEFAHLYRSATQAASVGGDFYDMFDLGDGRVGLVIGDVSGKGVGAASLTLVLRSAVRAYAYEGGTPALVVSKTSEMMDKLSALSTFATLFYGELHLASGRLVYCGGGHPPGLVRRTSGEVQELRVTSPLLGAVPGLHFVDEEAALAPGDLLLLYTDGILEARGSGGLFGEERLLRVLSRSNGPQHAATEVFGEVMRFTGGGLSDDAAVLALRLS